MNFLPTEDQLQLQRGVRDVLADRFPLDRLPSGYDADLWSTLTATGVFSLRTELDAGLAEAVLVFEELGRACVPGPLVGTFLAAGRVDGSATVLDATGQPLLVTNLDVADHLLVLSPDGVGLAPRSAVSSEPVAEPVDPLTSLHLLATPPAASLLADLDPIAFRTEGALLTAAIQVGLAARLTDLAVAYAKERQQFGHVIGEFQAVKHICADMLVRTELARVAVQAAAVTVDDDSPDAARLVHGAKMLADEAAATNGRAAIQVHGGMGFTWEVPVHFFLKRAWLHTTEFGASDDHAEALACLL